MRRQRLKHGRVGNWLLALLLAVLLPVQPAQGEWHPHAAIQAAAEAAVERAAGGTGARVQAAARPPDARLRLPRCPSPLQAQVGQGGVNSARTTVEVRCPDGPGWRLFVPVRLAVSRPVVVAARPLGRDVALTADDIILAELDAARLGYGYLTDPDQAIGQRLRRPVTEGTPLTPALVEAPVLVRRGQQVTLEARSGGITVQMAGEARGDGILGQVIDVENLSSGRMVQAVVRSARVAEVLLH